jgi:hypothetical protein
MCPTGMNPDIPSHEHTNEGHYFIYKITTNGQANSKYYLQTQDPSRENMIMPASGYGHRSWQCLILFTTCV